METLCTLHANQGADTKHLSPSPSPREPQPACVCLYSLSVGCAVLLPGSLFAAAAAPFPCVRGCLVQPDKLQLSSLSLLLPLLAPFIIFLPASARCVVMQTVARPKTSCSCCCCRSCYCFVVSVAAVVTTAAAAAAPAWVVVIKGQHLCMLSMRTERQIKVAGRP